MKNQEITYTHLPDTPGVYFFLGPKKEILYIGKATSLRDRVKSYFTSDLMTTRGPLLVKMMDDAKSIDFIETQSVLEALILEASQIKKHQPYYNSREKDNKSFNYVAMTDEDFPRVLVVRGRNLDFKDVKDTKGKKIDTVYGPFPHSGELREALKIIRRIFPYRDEKCIPASEQRDPLHPRACFNAQIGLCPGICIGRMNKREYRKQIKRLKLFFEGKKEELIRSLEKDMQNAAKKHEFEEAEKLKRTLYALEHIQDVALMKRDLERVLNGSEFRIEAYDIAHLAGTGTVGVMTVVIDGELDKSQYRKFKIRGKGNKIGINDTENLKEVLIRRLGHAEWPLPNLIVVDGSVAQINAAKEILDERGCRIEVVSVVKDERHKAREIIGVKGNLQAWEKSILLANSEAHRFAIGYHRKLRSKGFRI